MMTRKARSLICRDLLLTIWSHSILSLMNAATSDETHDPAQKAIHGATCRDNYTIVAYE